MSLSIGKRAGVHALMEDRMGVAKTRFVGLLAAGIALSTLVVASPASAQERAQKGIISIREVVIVGRVQKPVASLDVNKIQPKLTLAELRQPFLDRIEAAVTQEPF